MSTTRLRKRKTVQTTLLEQNQLDLQGTPSILSKPSHVTTAFLADYTKVQYQTKPSYVREVLYDNLRDGIVSRSDSSLVKKKNMLRVKRALGNERQVGLLLKL